MSKSQHTFVRIISFTCKHAQMDAVRGQHLRVLINWERLKKLCKRVERTWVQFQNEKSYFPEIRQLFFFGLFCSSARKASYRWKIGCDQVVQVGQRWCQISILGIKLKFRLNFKRGYLLIVWKLGSNSLLATGYCGLS